MIPLSNNLYISVDQIHENMLSLEEIQRQLQDRNLVMVAKETGLSHMTVWVVKAAKKDNFSYRTIKRLSDYLEGR